MNTARNVSNDLSNTLKVCNVICTILVVAIHFNSKIHIDVAHGFSWNFYFQEALTNGIARVAVPFFAMASGFFFFKGYALSLSSYRLSLKKRTNSILIPYFIAAAVILLTELVYGKMITLNDMTGAKAFEALVARPLSVQLWFLRDLFFITLLSPLVFWLLQRVGAAFTFLLMAMWFVDIEVFPLWAGRYLISMEVGAYFVLGAYLFTLKDKVEDAIKSANIPLLLVLCSALLLARVYIDPTMSNWYHNQYTTTSLLLQNSFIAVAVFTVLALSFKIRNQEFLQYLAGFTFFVYIYHLLPLSRVVGKLSDYVVADQYKFYFSFPLSILLTFSVAIALAKLTPRFYGLLSGGR